MAEKTPFENQAASTRRHWVRYSVRSVLIFVTLMVAVLGWVAKERNQSSREQLIGDELEKRGASVGFRGPYDSWELYEDTDPQSWLHDLQLRILGQRIFEVILYRANSSQVRMLSGLKSLRTIRISCTEPIDLTPIASQLSLQRLHVRSNGVTDLRPLSTLESLKELYLDCPGVHDVSPLGDLVNLRRLVLDSVEATDFSPLARLKELKELDLPNTTISEEQIDLLQDALPNCTIIR